MYIFNLNLKRNKGTFKCSLSDYHVMDDEDFTFIKANTYEEGENILTFNSYAKKNIFPFVEKLSQLRG